MQVAELAKWWHEAKSHAAPQHAARAVLDYMREHKEATLDELRELMTDNGADPQTHLHVLASMVDGGWLREGEGDEYYLGAKGHEEKDKPDEPEPDSPDEPVQMGRTRQPAGPGLFDEPASTPTWVRDPGPRSNNRWKSLKTGRLVYSEAMPGEADHEGIDHPEPAVESSPIAPISDPGSAHAGELTQTSEQARKEGARRSRNAVHFEKPIIGPSGARLNSYDWKYMLIEEPNARGDDIVTRRVSDWDEAEQNTHTGKEIVHHFHVTTPDGNNHIVSLETALNLLGFNDGSAGMNKVKNLAAASMQLAQMRQQQDELEKDDTATKYAKDAGRQRVADLERRVASLTKEAALAATGKNPVEHYRTLHKKAIALRDLFNKKPGVKGLYQGNQIDAIAVAAAPGNPVRQQQIYDEGRRVFNDLCRGARLNILGERHHSQTPVAEEIPERESFPPGRRISATPAWSDAKMRNWYFSHGEDAEESVARAKEWLEKYHPEYKEMVEKPEYRLLDDGVNQADIRLSLAPGEEYFTTPPGDGWEFVREGPHGGHVYRPVQGQGTGQQGQAQSQATPVSGKSGLLRRAAQAVASTGKSLGASIAAKLSPRNILSTIGNIGGTLAHVALHPVETVTKDIPQAIRDKYDSLYERYGASGALAIGGAYAAYYTAAALNPVMFTVPVPLTATVLGSARILRYGILKARGKEGVQFSMEDMPESSGDMLADAKAFIAEIAKEHGEEMPTIDDGLLAQVMAAMMEDGEPAQATEDTSRLSLQPGEAYFNSPPRDAENWTWVRDGKHGGHIYRRVEKVAEIGQPAPPTVTPEHLATGLKVIKAIAGQHANAAPLPKVRAALASSGIADRSHQDAVIHTLRKQGRIGTQGIEGRHGISDEERDAAIRDGDSLQGYLVVRMGLEASPVDSLRARVRRLARKKYPPIQMSQEPTPPATDPARGEPSRPELQIDEGLWDECQQIPHTPPSELPCVAGTVDGCKVIFVSGLSIVTKPDQPEDADHPHMDFVLAANDIEAPWVKREFGDHVLLIDAESDNRNWFPDLYHEAHERRLMGQGLNYEDAHEAANHCERELRLREEREEKPAVCTCPNWPRIKLRNGSTHNPECPVHQSWEAAGGFGNPNKVKGADGLWIAVIEPPTSGE